VCVCVCVCVSAPLTLLYTQARMHAADAYALDPHTHTHTHTHTHPSSSLPLHLPGPRLSVACLCLEMNIVHSRRLALLAVDTPSPSLSPLLSPPSSPTTPNLRINYASSHDSSAYPSSSTFHGPYMGIVLVVLLVTFFLMAAFSVYVRRYAFSAGGDIGGISMDRSGRPRGLDRSAIDGLPIVVFHCTKGESKEADSSVHAHEWRRRPDCVVCLTDFQEAENVRLLPKCEHCFHPECIDMWLFSHTTCPLCRRSLLPAASALATATATATALAPPSPSPPNVNQTVS
ncbi:hypothetical protein GOP47_0022112, partial [Adiantum capillus-veneris]